ncbi:hypothetical protein C4J87_3929 [Pseudomonas sp. R1-43-08]|nr:hypothetical protein C4J87_3929 [Pseudomonas sp. R1-43-08]
MIAAPVPGFEKLLICFISMTYELLNHLYRRYLHDLPFGLHAECLYFPRYRIKR